MENKEDEELACQFLLLLGEVLPNSVPPMLHEYLDASEDDGRDALLAFCREAIKHCEPPFTEKDREEVSRDCHDGLALFYQTDEEHLAIRSLSLAEERDGHPASLILMMTCDEDGCLGHRVKATIPGGLDGWVSAINAIYSGLKQP